MGLPVLLRILALLHALSSVVVGEGLGLAGVEGVFALRPSCAREVPRVSVAQCRCAHGWKVSPALSGFSLCPAQSTSCSQVGSQSQAQPAPEASEEWVIWLKR